MNRRLELHEQLVRLVGNNNVYFQPPASVQISYPCVIYSIGNGEAKHADNMVYKFMHNYQVTFIFKQPNVDVIEQVLSIVPMSAFERFYINDNLNHYTFKIYY